MESILNKNKRAQFSTSTFVIAGLIFSGIVAFWVIAIADLEQEYPGSNLTSPTFSKNYDKLTQTAESVEVIRSTASSEEGLTFQGAFDVTFGSFFTVVQLILATLGLFVGLGGNISTDFPFISSTVLNIFFILGGAVVTTIIVFKIVNAVGRNKV